MGYKATHDIKITQRSIDCITQHIKHFHKQSIDEREADFGEPCEACPYVKRCNLDWLSEMDTILKRSHIQIKLVRRENLGTQDSDDNCQV